MSRFKSGFPNLSRGATSRVPRYSGIFGLRKSEFNAVSYADIAHLEALFDYASRDERLSAYYLFTEPEGDIDRMMFEVWVARPVLNILDRLLHLYGDDFDEDALRAIYQEIERGVLDEELPIEIVVPIALTSFEAETRINAGDGASLEPMSDDWQLARTPGHEAGLATAHPCVVSAATHALVLTGWTMPNQHIVGSRTHEPSFYPIERVERWFDALRIVSGAQTGFAQINIRPIGWAYGWEGPLPAIRRGPLVRRYPPGWEQHAWIEPPSMIVSNAQVAEVAAVDIALRDAPRQLQLGARRLGSAALREDEGDAIIDLCIGLEAAVGDDSATEMTHKLALRTAALLARDHGHVAHEVFKNVKTIYAYRSAFVHGRTIEARRVVRTGDEAPMPTVDVARDYLRLTLGTLLRDGDLQEPRLIDVTLILGALPSPRGKSDNQ
jgi:hypothetical protein